eukprot:COSAG02_NODE_13559_length_1379_cov_1.150781_1_plen_105_part_00
MHECAWRWPRTGSRLGTAREQRGCCTGAGHWQGRAQAGGLAAVRPDLFARAVVVGFGVLGVCVRLKGDWWLYIFGSVGCAYRFRASGWVEVQLVSCQSSRSEAV